MVVIIAVYVLSFFFSLDVALGNTPYFSIFHFEVYRIVLSPLVGNSLITILLICFFYPMMGTRMETSIGSASYLMLLCTLSFVTNVLFDATCLMLYFVGTPVAVFWNCSGFWTILFALIVMECLQMPDTPRRLLCIPIEIPSKYFPLALYALFCLLSGPQLDFAVAMAVGYLYAKEHLNSLKLSTLTIQNMEQSGILSSLSRQTGWIHSSAALGMEAFAGGDRDVEAGGLLSGGMNMMGRGDDSTSSSSQANPFPGSGRSLASSGNGWGSTFGALAPSAPSHSERVSSKKEREALASRRLAALGVQGSNGKSSESKDNYDSSQYMAGASAPPKGDASIDSNLRTLLDMGFPRDDSIAALKSTNNSLDDALSKLA